MLESLGPAQRIAALQQTQGGGRVEQALLACECDARGRLGRGESDYPPRKRLAAALGRARSVDTAAVAANAMARGLSGPALGAQVAAARVQALAQGLC